MQSCIHKRNLVVIFGLIQGTMNFLAHSVLSPNEPLVMLGNLCGDFIKGSKFDGIHPDIVKGVGIHRAIDSFTDSHKLVREAKAIVRPDFRLYSGVVIDMFFDYFVAIQHADLKKHVKYVYDSANDNWDTLPEKFKEVLPYMQKFNWLEAYAKHEGLRKIMWQMRQRIGDKSPLDSSIDILISKELQFKGLFDEFWKDLLKEFS